MGTEELHEVAPGPVLGNISTQLSDGNIRTVCTLKEGIIPANSGLAAEDAVAFFALDPSNGIGQAVVAVEQHESPGETTVGIEALTPEAEHNIALLQGLVKIALEKSETTEATLAPECAEALDDQVIAKIGFTATQSGTLVFHAKPRTTSWRAPIAA